MTKGELLRFLEPFTDDLRIMVDAEIDGGRIQSVANCRYEHRNGKGVVYLEGYSVRGTGE